MKPEPKLMVTNEKQKRNLNLKRKPSNIVDFFFLTRIAADVS